MQPSPDVVVIGGGAIGCSVAYYLSTAGARVTVVEQGSLACQASGVAAGLLTPLAEAQELSPVLELGLRSLEIHGSLSQELLEATGISVEFHQTKVLRVAFDDEDVKHLKGTLAWQQRLGLRLSWCNADELRFLEPELSPDTQGGLYSEDEAQVEAYPYVLALARASELARTHITYSSAHQIQVHHGKVLGVKTSSHVISSGAVVIAMGPWSHIAGDWIGHNIPILPLKGQLLRVFPANHQLSCILFHNNSYVAPKPNGTILMGTTEENVGFDKEVTAEGRQRILEAGLLLAPNLQGAREQYAIAGLRPITPDGMPIIGPVSEVEGLYVATGHGRKGILLSAATGKIMADLILRDASDLPYENFLPQRFRAD